MRTIFSMVAVLMLMQAPQASAASCESLAGLALPNTTIRKSNCTAM